MKYLLPILLLSLIVTGCDSAEDAALREGNDAFAQADYATALTAYREAQEAAPDAAAPFYNTGNTHYRQEAYDLAELRGLQALKNNEGVEDSLTEDIYFNLGNSYFNLGQFDKAVTAYEEVLWRNPQAIDAQHNLELALRMQEQQEEQSSEDQQESGDEEENQEEEPSENGEDESDSSGEDSSESDEQSEEEEEEQQPQPDSGDSGEESASDESSESPQSSPGEEDESSGSPPTQAEAPAMQPLTSEQAAQLLESAAQNNESLQQYLQGQQDQSTIPGARDW